MISLPVTATARPSPTFTGIPATATRHPSPTNVLLTDTAIPPALTQTPSPTLSPTLAVTFGPWRRTPLTLMLHQSNASFDSVQFLREFLQIVAQNGLRATTYREMTDDPDLSAREEGRLFIVTIDDINLIAPIRPSVREMIALLLEAEYPAVLGVVTAGLGADPETAATLQSLSAQGWEIAAHTDTHQNLGTLEKLSPGDVRFEIRHCDDKIEALGVPRPVTLILPEGQMVENARLLYKEGVKWAVGITGGNRFDSTDDLIYVGREGPAGTAAFTFEVMMRRFNPQLQP
ncbi:MAG: polysaccharide deacetylase family protein [Chloroflexota bacterium]